MAKKTAPVCGFSGQPSGEPAWLWVLQYRTNEVWTTEILPAGQTSRTFFNSRPEVVAVSAVDRTGNLSSPAVMGKAQPAARREDRGEVVLIGR